MRLALFVLACALPAPLAFGNPELIQRISREQLAASTSLPAGVTVSVTGEPASPVIQVVSEGKAPARVELLTIKEPPVKTSFYAVRGEISYREVAGDGFMEMWSWFGEAAYFSRTLGEGGPMGKLSGQSDWRPCWLLFNATGTRQPPTKLVINLSLPGKGTVTVRNLRLEQAGSFEELLGRPPGSSLDSKAGLIGGIAGGVLGCLGSLLEFLASRGRARSFVVGACYTLAGVGAATVGAGLLALATLQALIASCVLLLVGIVCVVVFPVRLRRYLRQYRQTELRRIESMDAVGV